MAKKTADFSLEIRPNCSKTFERGPNSNGKRLIFSVLHLSDNLDDAKTVAVFAAGAPSDQDFDHLRAEMAKKTHWLFFGDSPELFKTVRTGSELQREAFDFVCFASIR